jgi:opacity protein-like surface antigen
MSRVTVLSKIAAFVAFLFLAIPAQADEIEPEPEPEPEPMVEEEPEPEPEPDPVPIPAIPETPNYARSGIYLGGDFSGAWYTELKDDIRDIVEPLGGTGNLGQDNPLGLGVHVGYRFHPHLSAEVDFLWLTSAKIEITQNKDTEDIVKVETLNLTGNIVGYILTGRLQPFVFAGGGLMHFDTKDKLNLGITTEGDNFAGRFGGGIDVYFNEHIVGVAKGGYVLPTGNADGLDFVFWSVGLEYRF